MADPFEKIEIPRRKFVRQLAAGTFAAPTLLSFTPTAQGQSGTDTPGSSQPPTPTPSGSLGPFPSQPPTPTPSGSLGPFASPTPTPSHSGGAGCLRFGEFVARGDVKLSDKSKGDQFKLKGLFVLGAGNDGIDPVTETVVIGLGPAQYTIPPGLFRARGSGKSLRFTFDGPPEDRHRAARGRKLPRHRAGAEHGPHGDHEPGDVQPRHRQRLRGHHDPARR